VDELIEKYIPNYTERNAALDHDSTANLVASDGKTYCLGQNYGATYACANNLPFINQLWLDALKLETPTNIEELTEVLRAFKTKDPNGNGQADENPLLMYIDSKNNTLDVLQLFGVPSYGDWIFIDDNKEVQLTAVQTGFRECMEWLHQCFEEGLLDVEVLSMDTNTFYTKLTTRNAGFFFQWRLHNMGYEEIADDCTVWVPGDAASFVTNYESAKPHTYITVTNQYPEATARLLNALLEKEMMYSLYLGEKDAVYQGWKYNEEGKILSYQNNDLSDEEKKTHPFAGLSSTGLIFAGSKFYNENIQRDLGAQERFEFANAIAGANGVQKYSNQLLTFVSLTTEQNDAMARVKTDATSAMYENIAKFIKEGVTDESWAAHVKIFEDMGCQKYVDLYQEGIDKLSF